MDEETIGRIRARVEAEIARLKLEKRPESIDDIETISLRVRDRVGEITAEELAKSAEGEADAGHVSKVVCSCGRWARYKGHRCCLVVSLSGVLRFSRGYYYCRLCDAGFCPADRLLGQSDVAGGTSFTLRVRQELVRLAAVSNSYSLASSILSDLAGVSVSVTQAQRMVASAGVIVEDHFEGQRACALSGEVGAQDFNKPVDTLYLQADGVMTPTQSGYKETKIGLAARSGPSSGSLDESKLEGTQYTSHLGDCETFGEHWYALACRAGLRQARQVVILGDGAAWLWNQADWHFGGARQILDFWHAVEHVWKLARVAFGEGNPLAAAWVQERKEEMLASRREHLLHAVRALANQFPSALENAVDLLNYLTNNRERMDYARYLAEGLRIGSGAIESGCKRLVSQRLKGPGMRWKEQSAQTICRLRCLLYSHQWSHFTEKWKQACFT